MCCSGSCICDVSFLVQMNFFSFFQHIIGILSLVFWIFLYFQLYECF